MRPVPDDATAELEVVVTPEMTVRFDRLGPVHPVYATYRMAQHFEEAGRALLLPFLEPGTPSAAPSRSSTWLRRPSARWCGSRPAAPASTATA